MADHGTVGSYTHGCRCLACTRALRDYRRQRRAEGLDGGSRAETSYDLALPDVGSSDPVYPELDADDIPELEHRERGVRRLPALPVSTSPSHGYRQIPLAVRLAQMPSAHRSPFSWKRSAITTRATGGQQGQQDQQGSRNAQAAVEWDDYARRLSLWHASRGENPDLVTLRQARPSAGSCFTPWARPLVSRSF
jgi:hypothetical protein